MEWAIFDRMIAYLLHCWEERFVYNPFLQLETHDNHQIYSNYPKITFCVNDEIGCGLTVEGLSVQHVITISARLANSRVCSIPPFSCTDSSPSDAPFCKPTQWCKTKRISSIYSKCTSKPKHRAWFLNSRSISSSHDTKLKSTLSKINNSDIQYKWISKSLPNNCTQL